MGFPGASKICRSSITIPSTSGASRQRKRASNSSSDHGALLGGSSVRHPRSSSPAAAGNAVRAATAREPADAGASPASSRLTVRPSSV